MASAARAQQAERFGGYGAVFADRPYMGFVVTFTLTQICAALIWVLMSVYAKQNYGIPESQYGFIAATNALMVVLFQVMVTQWTKRYAPLLVMALGVPDLRASRSAQWPWRMPSGASGWSWW